MLKYFVKMQVLQAQMRQKQKGQSLAEYGLILGLIAVICIGALTTLGDNLLAVLENIGAKLEASGAATTG